MLFFLVCLVSAEPSEVVCEGQYPHHLQGICVDLGGKLYWSFTTELVKTDANGKVTKKIAVPNHHGDLTYDQGKIWVAVNLGQFNNPEGKADSWVYVYDAAELELLKKYHTPEVIYGAGGIAKVDDRFFVVGGLPEAFKENYVYEYDAEFQYVKKHIVDSGHTHLGIQTATYYDGAFWFGCYGRPPQLLKVDRQFQLLGRYDFECSLGIAVDANHQLLIGRGSCQSGKGCNGRAYPGVPDAEKGIRILKD